MNRTYTKADIEAQQNVIMQLWLELLKHDVDKVVELTEDDGSKTITQTRSKPWMLNGIAVILVDCKTGCYRLDRLKAL